MRKGKGELQLNSECSLPEPGTQELGRSPNISDFELGNRAFLAKEYEKAVRIYESNLSAESQAALGFCYEFGHGVEQNFTMAEDLYLKAAKENQGLALARLCFLRYYGRPNIVINRVESEEWKRLANELGPSSVEWLRVAAEEYEIPTGIRELIIAMYALGVCYHDGVGVACSKPRAVSFYRKAAAANDPRGLGVLGFCYGEGMGVELNAQLAFHYYKRAAEMDETVSMYNLGYCYERGLHVNVNYDEVDGI